MNRDQLLAGAAIAALAIIYGLQTGTVTPGPESQTGHFTSVADGGADGGGVATCQVGQVAVPFSAYLQRPLMSLADLDAGSGARYWVGWVFAWPQDGGVDPGGGFLGGDSYVIWAEPMEYGCDAGAPALEAWVQGAPSAPWACACSSGTDCSWIPPALSGLDAGAAPLGLTLNPGTWFGAGCVRKPCVELAGFSSWPATCPGGS